MRSPSISASSTSYIIKKVEAILDQVPQEHIDHTISLFFSSNNIFVYGAGRSGLVAKAFAIRLVHLGFQTFVIGESITAPVQKDDLVVIVSGSGETIPAVMTAEIAHNLGARIISITGKKDSEIATFADITLFIASDCNEDKRKKFAPLGTLFEASVWILLDGIIADLLHKKKETEENMRKRHATLQQ